MSDIDCFIFILQYKDHFAISKAWTFNQIFYIIIFFKEQALFW